MKRSDEYLEIPTPGSLLSSSEDNKKEIEDIKKEFIRFISPLLSKNGYEGGVGFKFYNHFKMLSDMLSDSGWKSTWTAQRMPMGYSPGMYYIKITPDKPMPGRKISIHQF